MPWPLLAFPFTELEPEHLNTWSHHSFSLICRHFLPLSHLLNLAIDISALHTHGSCIMLKGPYLWCCPVTWQPFGCFVVPFLLIRTWKLCVSFSHYLTIAHSILSRPYGIFVFVWDSFSQPSLPSPVPGLWLDCKYLAMANAGLQQSAPPHLSVSPSLNGFKLFSCDFFFFSSFFFDAWLVYRGGFYAGCRTL